MSDISEQRPSFFEGEYLGADDLQQIVVYLRDQIARHALGGHAWGIAAGLDLVEQAAPSGGTDVYLLPGYAVDGYGRAVIVVNPLRLTVDLFTGLASGPVPVWIRYDQSGTQGVRPGFEVCTCTDAYARMAEGFALKAAYLQAVSERQSGISVAGESVDDAREAPRLFNDKGPILCDASVPYQDLPLGDESQVWWIPLGLVGWTSGVPGTLRSLSDDERLLSRRRRRYLAAIAESVLAADGLIRLRRRDTPWQSGTATEDLCALDDVADPSHDGDLRICGDAPRFNELVWIEGRVRITDDTRLLGGRLEFRNKTGSDYLPSGAQPGSVPLIVERQDRNKNADLRLLIGTASTGSNRFVIAQAGTPTPDPTDPCNAVHFDAATSRVVVQDDGKVGVGTETPDQMLNVQGPDKTYVHVRSTTGPHDLYLGANKDSAVVAVLNTDDLRVRSGGADPDDDAFTRLTLKSGGQVGIGTTSPDASRLVTLETKSGSYLIARTNPDAPDTPKEVLLGADGTGAIVSAMTANTDLQLRGGNNTSAVWIKDNANVGVATNVPTERLHVNGNIRAQGNVTLGSAGDLFAPGGVENLRIIVGSVDEFGNKTAGTGFTVSRTSMGRYTVAFTIAFPAPPVVLANSVNPADDDDLAVVANVSANGFDIHMTDVTNSSNTPTAEDDAFSFVVFGLR